MRKNYFLYIDDIRNPINDNWIVARNYKEAINIITKNNCPFFISFDHDLGEEKTGYDVAKWLIETDLNYPGFIHNNFDFKVHSANPVGKENIEKLLRNYLRKRNE